MKIGARLRSTLDDPATPAVGLGRKLRAQARATGHVDTVAVTLDVVVSDANLADIRAIGATITSSSPRWNQVAVEATAAQIEALARLPAIASISQPHKPFHRAQPGTVVNQAGAVIHADNLTNTSHINGAGQVIGIISDSINFSPAVGAGTTVGTAAPFTLTGTIPQNRGDLPPAIQVVEFGNTNDLVSDEGEAMMELCYKLAPGAAYAFGSSNKAGSIYDQTNMADTIAALSHKAHCTIIADDIGFYDEPMFQDGPIAQAANEFVNAGGMFLSAYGNDGAAGVETTYVDSSPTFDPHTGYPSSRGFFPTGADFHDWGIGGATPGFLPILIQGDCTIVMEWSQPFTKYGLGAGSQSNYDMYLFDAPIASKDHLVDPLDPFFSQASDSLTVSMEPQGGTGSPFGNPFEIIQFSFPNNNSHLVYLAIDRVGGVSGDLLRLVFSANTVGFPNGAVGLPAMTGYGHPTARGVIGVAAVPFTAPNFPEPFTSKGGIGTAGVPFYYDTTGVLLHAAPELRDKPELAAPDGVSTSNSNFAPFFGTSAATPNAAAAAALAWQANPALTNDQIKARLIATAQDVTGAPSTAGNDSFTGHGLVQAQRAAGVPVTAITSAASGLHEAGTVDITVSFAVPVTVTGTPLLVLNTAPARFATYLSGSGTADLVFRYTITSGDASTHLDLASNSALALNGGTITATSTGATFTAGDPIMLLLPTPGAAGSLGANTTIAIDTTGPVTTIAGSPAAMNIPALTFVVSFTQPVTGVGIGSFTITNGTITSVAGTAGAYTVHATATAPGAVTLSIAANTVFDLGSLGNHAASGTASYDLTPPTLVITPLLREVVTTNAVTVTFTFDEAVTGFTASDVGITNGVVGTLTGSGAVYHMTVVTGTPGPMAITVLAGTVTDVATNASVTDATATVSVTAVPSPVTHGCGLGTMFASLLSLGLLALMARLRGRDGVAGR